ncbi:hypothetical protein DLH98_25150 [Vibrio parahaemolyticus]|uniref:hypothetical protein n=1 Tax=Vibrio parahaemolyticus TaxID=670 RepID=UPI0004A21DCC|nr:hypothetical protein [Vibrio parahaemolyticus]APC90655.1 hypothetical protein FORC22_4795 [Vibrio parahaemolyticus]EGQ8927048.1 hypothetical protein [Vibrio parahaemolyticus]EGR2860122.1 hypothetical protein [Vibrio parahaemolyticus]EGR2948552.1 hypothetical protein [Vibrio parahaemolyticus]EGR3067839.1 hypothetical protein [Vibrio parahaemolyticus]
MKKTISITTVKGKDWRRVSKKAWQFLMKNRHCQILYYEDVAAYVGTNSRNVHRALAYILEFCERHRLPPLTGLVINKTVHRHQNRRMPGGGFRIHNANNFYYPESIGFEALYQQALEDIKQIDWENVHYHPKQSDYLELKQYLCAQKQEKGKVPTPIACLQQLARTARNK